MVPHSVIPVDWRTVDKLYWNRRLIWSYSYQDHMVMKRQDEKFRKDIVKVFWNDLGSSRTVIVNQTKKQLVQYRFSCDGQKQITSEV